MSMTVDQIARAAGAERKFAVAFTEPLNTSMDRFAIHTKRQVAAFMATVGIESARLTAVEEGLYYRDPARLAQIYPRAFRNAESAVAYAKNPKGLSELLYKGYHGRGLIQLTWEKNYILAGEALGYDYAGQPELLLQPKHAALTAAWFWSENGCNVAADRGDMSDVTRRVNGPARLHLAERTALYNATLEWLEL